MATMASRSTGERTIRQEFLSVPTTATLIDAHEQTIRNMMRDGRLAYVRIGKTLRIPASEIERLKGEARRNGGP